MRGETEWTGSEDKTEWNGSEDKAEWNGETRGGKREEREQREREPQSSSSIP